MSHDLANELFRCPIDPKRVTHLVNLETKWECQQCAVSFRIREGIPCLLISEATLPETCTRIDELPCRKRS
ncbi:MAG: hypothetical protein R3B84_21520 [Zavarzinella sp.]